MRKEKIINKIQDALGISDAETNYAVKELLEKIQDKIEFGSAVKIPKIGLFFLTKLRNPDFIYAEEEPVLLYNDPHDYEFSDTYGSISIPEAADETLIDKSFSISVNKPIAPIWEKDALAGHSFLVVQKILESKIDGLLDLSEKIQSYELDKRAHIVKMDLYQDAEAQAKTGIAGLSELAEEEPKAKEIPYTQPIISKEIEAEFKEEEIAEPDDWESAEEIEGAVEELPMEETPDSSGYVEFEWNFDYEIQKDVFKDAPIENKEEGKKKEEKSEEEEKKEDKLEPPKAPIIEEPSIVLQDDDEPVKETGPEIAEQPEQKDEETPGEVPAQDDERTEVPQIKEKQPQMESAVILEVETTILGKGQKEINDSVEDIFMEEESKKKLSPAFWVILILMFVFTGVGLYYFFIEPSKTKVTETADVKIEPEKAKKEAVPENSGEQTAAAENKAGAAKTPAGAGAAKTKTETATAKTQTASVPVQNAANQQRQQKTSGSVQIVEDPADKLISENIFYNGKKYSVQISSWKSQNIAKTEAEKLLKSGYNAYVLKAYVEKFKATYYRVRIGGFNTADEARKFARSY